MRLKFTLLSSLLTATLALSANPLSLPEYEREVKLTFPNEETAKAAKLELLPLPEGKSFAFSTRWDDSNPNHVRMAELLAKHGFKATFYLCSTSRKGFYSDVLPQLIRKGHSIGNHTLNHRNLATLIPNEVARQILQNRVEYETRSNQTINSFVLPYCAYKNATDSLSPLRIGEALYRSGELGSPEYHQNLEKEYGMPEGSWGTSRLFGINDRTPSAETFDRAIAERTKNMKPGEVRHATLGLHTWQDDAGFETLDKIFAKYANRSDWWYCNENEYNAYRYAQLHTRVEKRVEGANAIFKLTGPTPAALGSDTPLWAKVTPATADGRTMVKLPHTLRMPEQIDMIISDGARVLPSKKFPFLEASLIMNVEDEEPGVILTISNRGRLPLTNVTVAFRLPLLFTCDERVPRNDLEMINPEVTRTVSHYFPEHRRTALYQCGPLFAAAEVNFEIDGKPQRLWVCTKTEIPQFAEAVPRDTALALGPLPPEQFTEQLLAAASNPEETLSSWSPLASGKWALPYIVKIPKKEKQQIAVALTFRADAVIDTWKLHVPKNNVKGVFLNGKKVEDRTLPTPIVTRKGLNRLVVLYDTDRGGEQMISVTRGSNPNLPVEFVRE